VSPKVNQNTTLFFNLYSYFGAIIRSRNIRGKVVLGEN
jgi:hypothetical protein